MNDQHRHFDNDGDEPDAACDGDRLGALCPDDRFGAALAQVPIAQKAVVRRTRSSLSCWSDC